MGIIYNLQFIQPKLVKREQNAPPTTNQASQPPSGASGASEGENIGCGDGMLTASSVTLPMVSRSLANIFTFGK
jgi:hypothetical protein